MQYQAGFDPHEFVARGLAAKRRQEELGQATDSGGGFLASLALEAGELARFRQAGSWDAQRFKGEVQPEWVDDATINIGLYAAAAGMSPDDILQIQNKYAERHSSFEDPKTKLKVDMSPVYTHPPERNVQNTLLGFELYKSGRIAAPK